MAERASPSHLPWSRCMTLAISLDLATSRDEAMISLQRVRFPWQKSPSKLLTSVRWGSPRLPFRVRPSAPAQHAWGSRMPPVQRQPSRGQGTALASNLSAWESKYQNLEEMFTSSAKLGNLSLNSYFNMWRAVYFAHSAHPSQGHNLC